MNTSQEEPEWVSLKTVDPDLVRRITGGNYEIDPHAVAEAMLRRSARLSELRRLSRVLVASEFECPPACGEQS